MARRRTVEDDRRERRALTEAMERLLAGAPRASEGRLTKSELAREAGLQRHHVTHRHPDLGEEFMRRVAEVNGEPVQVTRLKDALQALRTDHEARGAELRDKDALLKRYADHLATAVLRIRLLERQVESLRHELADQSSGRRGNVVEMPSRP